MKRKEKKYDVPWKCSKSVELQDNLVLLIAATPFIYNNVLFYKEFTFSDQNENA